MISLAVHHTIPAVLSHFTFDKLYAVAKQDDLTILSSRFGEQVIAVDEDSLSEHLTQNQVAAYIDSRIGKSYRSGWYFQQFIKLQFSYLDGISSNYLVWDADAIPLRPIQFIDSSNQVFLAKSNEYHLPYFKVIKRLIGIDKQVSHSFITEHMVFTKKHVQDMIAEILGSADMVWWKVVLDKVESEDMKLSGFSEYELYGNYVTNKVPGHFLFRPLSTLRKGKAYLGENPNRFLLRFLSLAYDYVSIERRDKKIEPNFIRLLKILKLVLFRGLSFRR